MVLPTYLPPPPSFSQNLNSENTLPFFDGQITPWVSSWARESPGYSGRTVLYCNGVGTSTYGHARECMELSSVCKCTVLGVYNQSGIPNFPVKDWLHTSLDGAANASGGWGSPLGIALNLAKLAIGKAQWALFDSSQSILDTIFNVMQGIVGNLWGIPGVTPDHRLLVARYLLNYNPAVLSYFDLLNSWWGANPILAVGYSQGNWILSNALSGLLAVRVGAGTLPSSLHAFGLAPPNFFWPPGATVHLYANNNDLIPTLSLGAGRRGDTTSWSEISPDLNPLSWAASIQHWHAQEEYLQHSQFVLEIRPLLGLDPLVDFPEPAIAAEDPAAQDVASGSTGLQPRPGDFIGVGQSPVRGAPLSRNVGEKRHAGAKPIDPKRLVPKPNKPRPRRG